MVRPLAVQENRKTDTGETQNKNKREPPDQRQAPDIPWDGCPTRQPLIEPGHRPVIVRGDQPPWQVRMEIFRPAILRRREIIRGSHHTHQVPADPVIGPDGADDPHAENRDPFRWRQYEGSPEPPGKDGASQNRNQAKQQHAHGNLGDHHVRPFLNIAGRTRQQAHGHRDTQSDHDRPKRHPPFRLCPFAHDSPLFNVLRGLPGSCQSPDTGANGLIHTTALVPQSVDITSS